MTMSKNTKRLPDAYLKSKDSNNNKLLLLQEQSVNELLEDLSQIDASADIFNAVGKTLDLYGEMYGQKRGTFNDAQYRHMILAKISSFMANTDATSITNSVLQIFNAKGNLQANEFIIVDDEEPSTVRIERLPFDALLTAGFTAQQAVDIVKMLLPVGISVKADNFEGTFEFAELSNEYDETAGFADDSQTIGGFFGLLYGE